MTAFSFPTQAFAKLQEEENLWVIHICRAFLKTNCQLELGERKHQGLEKNPMAKKEDYWNKNKPWTTGWNLVSHVIFFGLRKTVQLFESARDMIGVVQEARDAMAQVFRDVIHPQEASQQTWKS